MTITEMTSAYDWHGQVLIGQDGEKIGKIDDVYRHKQSDTPEWDRVTTGFFGTHSSFVPLLGAVPAGENVEQIEADRDTPGHAA